MAKERDAQTGAVFSNEQIASLTAPIDQARTLPREAFTSDSFYEAEVEGIYSQRWVAVLFEFEVAEPGDVMPFELCGIPLVAVRDSDLTLRVFHNIVPYDGCHAVMSRASGLTEIETPYHGWVYDLRGRLTAIPFWDGTRQGDLASVREFDTNLGEVACESFLRTIFVNLGAQPEPFDEFTAPVRRLLADYDLDNATAALDESGDVICTRAEAKANWKTNYENACLNVLHENFVHRLYRASNLHPRVDESGKKTFFEVIDGDLLGLGFRYQDFTATYGEVDPDGPHLGHGDAPPEKSSFSTHFPNLYLANGPEYIEVGLALPDGPECTVDRRIYLLRKDIATDLASGHERRQILEGFAAAGVEDTIICEAVQRARKSPVHSQRFYSPFWDELHYRFTQLVVRDLTRKP